MNIGSQTPVADLATQYPATIRVFQRHGIDFCCGGRRALGEVCADQKLSLADLTGELETALSSASPSGVWQGGSLRALVAHIVERYHRPLDEELPRLGRMMEKVLRVHGERHPGLQQVAATFGAIVGDLRPHMQKEERVLFPFIGRLEAAGSGGEASPPSPFGTVRNPIGAMEFDHEMVGGLLARLREQTGDFGAPGDACNTYRGLYHGFADLDRELHEHIHLENNILFPGAIRLEAEWPGRVPAGR